MLPDPVLLVSRAQRDGSNNSTRFNIWISSDMNSTSAKTNGGVVVGHGKMELVRLGESGRMWGIVSE